MPIRSADEYKKDIQTEIAGYANDIASYVERCMCNAQLSTVYWSLVRLRRLSRKFFDDRLPD